MKRAVGDFGDRLEAAGKDAVGLSASTSDSTSGC